MKKFYQSSLFIFLVVAAATTFATELRISRSIQWNVAAPLTSEGKAIPVFAGFGLRDYAGDLPVFVWQLADVSASTLISARVENIVTIDNIPTTFLPGNDSVLIGTSVKPVISRRIIRGTYSYEVGFVPIIRNSDGSFSFIRSFDLVIDKTENMAGTKQSNSVPWKSSSVLAEGTWYKLFLETDGIYRITYNDLVSMGIDPTGIKPSELGLYGSDGEIIPEANSDTYPDDLSAIPVEVIGGDDGSFDPGDYIRFWGNGPERWTYSASSKRFKPNKNPYTKAVPCFLRIDDPSPARLGSRDNLSVTPTNTASTFLDFRYFEPDSMSVSKTGRVWVSKAPFKTTTPREFTMSFPNTVFTSAATLEISVAGWSDQINTFYANINGSQIIKLQIGSLTGTNLTYNTAIPKTKAQSFFPMSDDFNTSINYDMAGSNAIGYLEYYSLQVSRKLIYTGGMMPFFYSPERETQIIPEIILNSTTEGTHIWDVTYPDSAVSCNYQYTPTTGEARIVLNATTYHRFIAFNDGDELSPLIGSQIQNQNLHSLQPADYIIITPDSLKSQAERLASLHSTYGNISCLVVTVEQVLNEFGRGIADPAAIRGFVRMLYDRGLSNGKAPKYLLLFGDGSYDPLDRISGNEALIPAYESLESFNLGVSYVSDDFYGLMDTGEGDSSNGSLDLGVGRLPVSNLTQAKQVVDKIERYITNPASSMSDWRNHLTFVADDEDGITHIDNSNDLVMAIDTLLSGQIINKVYLDAFVQTSTPSGDRYPDAKVALNNYVEKGSLVVNYTGHGGELGWSEEKVLEIPDIEAWDNYYSMPLFITATCEFSRFDNPELLSAGERVLLNAKGGGIGLITTSRIAYAHINFGFNSALYQIWFANGRPADYTFGDLIMGAKNANNNRKEMRNITLLGDPALKPLYPENHIVITKVNNTQRDQFSNTLTALEEVSYEGEVVSPSGTLLNDFNGELTFKLLDKPMKTTTLVNDPKSQPFTFYVTNKLLTEGRASVKNGKFSFELMAPRDMLLVAGYPLLSLYASDSVTDASGHEKGLLFEGIDPDQLNNDQPPVIKAWIDSRSFSNGDIVSATPLLIADLSDDQGINFTGLGFGHDITATIDGETENTLVLNEYYQPALDDFRKGSLSITLSGLSVGTHTLVLKAFDINNNVSTVTLNFVIDGNTTQLNLSDVSIKPNPFSESTTIEFTHNAESSNITATLEVYDLTGKLVYISTETPEQLSGTLSSISWNGRSNTNYPVNAGIYPARLIITDSDGAAVSTGFKLIKTYPKL